MDKLMLDQMAKTKEKRIKYAADIKSVKSFEKRLNELCSLEQGWDGYNAKPVSFENARYANELFERIIRDIRLNEEHSFINNFVYSVSPGTNQDLQIEISAVSGELDLTIHIKAPEPQKHCIPDLIRGILRHFLERGVKK